PDRDDLTGGRACPGSVTRSAEFQSPEQLCGSWIRAVQTEQLRHPYRLHRQPKPERVWTFQPVVLQLIRTRSVGCFAWTRHRHVGIVWYFYYPQLQLSYWFQQDDQHHLANGLSFRILQVQS